MLKPGSRLYISAGSHAHLHEIEDLVWPFAPTRPITHTTTQPHNHITTPPHLYTPTFPSAS
ncbi:MAG: hypothetical protein L0322_06935, partial [Chloroflexi bacterium]|nr:hypothetical protein [Chloroflexota bacterium]